MMLVSQNWSIGSFKGVFLVSPSIVNSAWEVPSPLREATHVIQIMTE